MKIMICGKGGAGKCVVAIMLARALIKKGHVYMIEADE
jgi:CO dehydrogenase nickel-insertion accessory protein CooC1